MAGASAEVSTKTEVDTKGRTGSGKRRSWPEALKRQIVAETLAPGSSVSLVARRHDVNTNLVFSWRRAFLSKGQPVTPAVANGAMVPVEITPERRDGRHGGAGRSTGVIEVEFGGGVRVFVRGRVAPELLRQVFDLLR